MVVVPNGIDTELFAPDAVARARVRAEWGVGENEILVGLVGRVDPLKGHDTFLSAAASVMRRYPAVRWVCIGGGGDARLLAQLQLLSEQLGVASALRWVGERHDKPAVYNALDVAVSPSISEGFSNVIGEALATGVTCVATDIGDSARIVGDSALVVPVSDVVALTQAIEVAIGRVGPESRGECRARILELFSVGQLVSNTAEVLHLRPGGRDRSIG
jgi:glycosyltransferase involved in cell wall biosynthesis